MERPTSPIGGSGRSSKLPAEPNNGSVPEAFAQMDNNLEKGVSPLLKDLNGALEVNPENPYNELNQTLNARIIQSTLDIKNKRGNSKNLAEEKEECFAATQLLNMATSVNMPPEALQELLENNTPDMAVAKLEEQFARHGKEVLNSTKDFADVVKKEHPNAPDPELLVQQIEKVANMTVLDTLKTQMPVLLKRLAISGAFVAGMTLGIPAVISLIALASVPLAGFVTTSVSIGMVLMMAKGLLKSGQSILGSKHNYDSKAGIAGMVTGIGITALSGMTGIPGMNSLMNALITTGAVVAQTATENKRSAKNIPQVNAYLKAHEELVTGLTTEKESSLKNKLGLDPKIPLAKHFTSIREQENIVLLRKMNEFLLKISLESDTNALITAEKELQEAMAQTKKTPDRLINFLSFMVLSNTASNLALMGVAPAFADNNSEINTLDNSENVLHDNIIENGHDRIGDSLGMVGNTDTLHTAIADKLVEMGYKEGADGTYIIKAGGGGTEVQTFDSLVTEIENDFSNTTGEIDLSDSNAFQRAIVQAPDADNAPIIPHSNANDWYHGKDGHSSIINVSEEVTPITEVTPTETSNNFVKDWGYTIILGVTASLLLGVVGGYFLIKNKNKQAKDRIARVGWPKQAKEKNKQAKEKSEGKETLVMKKHTFDNPFYQKISFGEVVIAKDKGFNYTDGKDQDRAAVYFGKDNNDMRILIADGVGGKGEGDAGGIWAESFRKNWLNGQKENKSSQEIINMTQEQVTVEGGLVYVDAKISPSGELKGAFVGDCRLVIYDGEGNIKFSTEDQCNPMRRNEVLNAVSSNKKGLAKYFSFQLKKGYTVCLFTDGVGDNLLKPINDNESELFSLESDIKSQNKKLWEMFNFDQSLIKSVEGLGDIIKRRMEAKNGWKPDNRAIAVFKYSPTSS